MNNLTLLALLLLVPRSFTDTDVYICGGGAAAAILAARVEKSHLVIDAVVFLPKV
jgi:hypothetical protein